jgi:CP family cyanate transporter-like MFS transporter
LIVESIIELVGFILLVLNIEPLLASALIGIGAGGLFPLNRCRENPFSDWTWDGGD